MKKSDFLCFIVSFMLLFLGCKEDSLTVNEKLQGRYIATTFTEAGQSDGGIDILSNGGSLKVELLKNSVAIGHISIPNGIGSNYGPIETDFSCSYSINLDTLYFKNSNTFLDRPPIFFMIKENRLETPLFSGRLKALKIILGKL